MAAALIAIMTVGLTTLSAVIGWLVSKIMALTVAVTVLTDKVTGLDGKVSGLECQTCDLTKPPRRLMTRSH